MNKLDELFESILNWGNHAVITREEGQDSFVIDLASEQPHERFKQGIDDMLCMEDDDKIEVLNASFSQVSMMGAITLELTQDGNTFQEVMSVVRTTVY